MDTHQDEIEVENSFVEGEIYSGLLTGYENVKDIQYALTKFEDCYNKVQKLKNQFSMSTLTGTLFFFEICSMISGFKAINTLFT